MTYESLCDAFIKYLAEAGKHTGRLLTFKKLQQIYANSSLSALKPANRIRAESRRVLWV